VDGRSTSFDSLPAFRPVLESSLPLKELNRENSRY
jgi:hypothetical protein